jgi:hypothetical protein
MNLAILRSLDRAAVFAGRLALALAVGMELTRFGGHP